MSEVATHPAEILDIYLRVCADESQFMGQYLSLMDDLQVNGPVLDCAVGTGFGTVPLLKAGSNIVCSDGSVVMLEKFIEYAAREKVHARPLTMQWGELGSYFPATFGLVMCRGNSLAYADSWDHEASRAEDRSLSVHLRGMYDCIADGGYLFVDIPTCRDARSEASVTTLRHSGRLDNGDLVLIDEEIHSLPSERSRQWRVTMQVGDARHSFRRQSALFFPDQFQNMLSKNGFRAVTEYRGYGIRGHYQSFIAQK